MTTRFVIIGENIHASRVLNRDGKRVVTGPEGRVAIRYIAVDGTGRELPVPDAVLSTKDGVKGRIKHVQAALIAGMSGIDCDMKEGRAYLEALAVRQVAAGAAFLDLNVDEISADEGAPETMQWLGVVDSSARPDRHRPRARPC
jgi:hypothetical protein